jgi:methionyl-tRNA synthetase
MAKYGVEALRYYLMRDIGRGSDADFSEERLIERYQSELSNKIGNLVNRTLSMLNSYCEGQVNRGDNEKLEGFSSYFLDVYQMCMNEAEIGGAQIFEEDNQGRPVGALGAILRLAEQANLFVETEKPWRLAKDNQKKRLGSVLYQLSECVRILAILISPVLPKAAHGIFDQLNWKMELSGKEERFRLEDAKWGGLPDGHVVGKPVPLFPRIEQA